MNPSKKLKTVEMIVDRPSPRFDVAGFILFSFAQAGANAESACESILLTCHAVANL